EDHLAFGVEPGDVAGVIAAVLVPGLACRLGIAPIAGGNHGARNQDLAVRRELDLLGAAGLADLARRMVERAGGGDAAGFRRTVTLDDRYADALPRQLDIRRESRGACAQRAQSAAQRLELVAEHA